MQAFCTPSSADRFAERLLADADCQAFGLVERGYAALAQPSGTVATALTGLLVIAVAFFGYRLLLGRGLLLSDAVVLVVKIGIVLLIATSWASWQALAYNGLARAPTEIASEMLVGIGAPHPLASLERTLDDIAAAGIGYRTRAGIASPWVGGPAAAAMTLNVSAVLLTLATVGILVAARVVLAILLAIAPAMAGLILFNGTRGMAQGWLGAMAAAALIPLFVLLVAAVEFAILAPMIARLLAEQAEGNFETATVMPIGLVTIVFGIALLLAMRAAGRIGRGIRLDRNRGLSQPTEATTLQQNGGPLQAETLKLLPPPAQPPGAARALEAIARREMSSTSARGAFPGIAARASRASALRDSDVAGTNTNVVSIESGRAYSMRSAPRRSRAAARRDG